MKPIKERVLFIGAGAVGSYLGGWLSATGHSVTIIDPWHEQVEYVNKNGIEVSDYVLQNFDEDEIAGVEKISKDITESISILVEKKLDLFSSTVNNK